MVKRCCTKDCPERRPACSDYCEKYKAWKKELAKERLPPETRPTREASTRTTLTRSSGSGNGGDKNGRRVRSGHGQRKEVLCLVILAACGLRG